MAVAPTAVRAHIIFAGLAGAFVLWFLGAIFDLNGAQWDWWSGACRTAIVPLLLAALRLARRARRERPRLQLVYAGGVVCGCVLVAASVIAMAERYSDPYSGSYTWPHVLACFAFVGFLIVLASLTFALTGPHRHPRGR
jgi:hypothetical protein